MSARLLIVALDSAEPLLIREWARAGMLPNLARLLDAGPGVELRNFPGFGNGVYWPSIATGTDPSHHGRYYRRQTKAPDYALGVFEQRDFKVPPFWKRLEDDGLRVAVVDPVESPGGGLRAGIEITEWYPHGRVEPPASNPPGLIRELIARYGDDPFGGSTDHLAAEGVALDWILPRIGQRIAAKTEAMLDLLTREDWDLFFVSYGDAHDVGHLAWHLHEAARAGGGGDDPLLDCCRRLDAALGRLMEEVAPGGRTIVLTGPGMEANVGANPLLPEILRALEGRPRTGPMQLAARVGRGLVRSSLLPQALRRRLARTKARVGLRVQQAAGRRLQSLPHNDNAGPVRLCVRGRDPHGVVAPGPQFEALCADLAKCLEALRDASGERHLVSRVVQVREQFSGPRLAQLPDLMVVWNREADVGAVVGGFGRIANPAAKVRTGDHSVRGLALSDRPLEGEGEAPIAPDRLTPVLERAARELGVPRRWQRSA